MKQQRYNCNICHSSWLKSANHCPLCGSADFGLYDYGICDNCHTGDFIEDRPLYDNLCPDCFRKSITDDTVKKYMIDAEKGKTPLSKEQILDRVFFFSDDTRFQRFLWKALKNIIDSCTDEDYAYYMAKLHDGILDNLDEFYDWYKGAK